MTAWIQLSGRQGSETVNSMLGTLGALNWLGRLENSLKDLQSVSCKYAKVIFQISYEVKRGTTS